MYRAPEAIARFLRENLFGMIAFTIVGSIVSSFIYEFLKIGPTPGVVSPPLSSAFAPCTKGTVVKPNDASFNLKFVAVDDGEALRLLMQKLPGDYAREIGKAVQRGEIKRVLDPTSLNFHIYGISTD